MSKYAGNILFIYKIIIILKFKGQIKSFDDKFLGLFGYFNKKDLVNGKDINEFIPHIKLPMCTITNVRFLFYLPFQLNLCWITF